MVKLRMPRRSPIRRLVGLTAVALAGASLFACGGGLPETASTDALLGERASGGKARLCIETATNVPGIAESASIVDVVPGEPLPGSLIEALERVRLTRHWLDLPDLPLVLSDFESLTMGDYEELLSHDSPDPGDAYDLILRSADGIRGVPGSRNAVVYVAHLRQEDQPESWYVFDWRYELPCPPEES